METIIQKFVKTAYKYPKNKAVSDATGWYSYERLETITDQLAQTIIRRSDRLGLSIPELITDDNSGPRIALIMPRTKDFIIAALGTLKAGCPYVPIDPHYPSERIATILEDSKCQQIVTTQNVLSEIKHREGNDFLTELGFSYDTISLVEDVIQMSPSVLHVSNFDLSQDENEGLLIYTSGSTGKPKGVVHSQRILLSTMVVYPKYTEINPGDTWGCMAGFTFIASMIDLYIPFTIGASLYIMSEQECMDLQLMHDAIVKNEINYMFMPPKLAETLLNTYDDLPLKAVVCAGEKMQRRPKTDIQLIDFYGASETGGVISRVTGENDNPTTLGSISEGCFGFLLDEDGNRITEPGKVGEFCVSSDQLAISYNNMPELTAEKFVPCPFLEGKRMYKTGDLMSLDKDGNYEFHGRKDFMVKLNGYRVELGEIEAAAVKFDKVNEAACVMKRVNGGDNLCLYYTTKDDFDESELKEFLSVKLAHYMVPSIFIRQEKMPRNANGKIDRKILPDPVVESEEYVAPSTSTEKKLQAIFSKVMGLETKYLGVTTDLLYLGLNSILAMQVSVMVAKELHLELSVKAILSLCNIQMIADLIDSGSLKKNTEFKPYPKRGVYPATKGMLGYMYADKDGYRTLPILCSMRIERMTLDRMVPALKAVFDAHPSIKVQAAFVGKKAVIYRNDKAEMPIRTFKLNVEPTPQWIAENCLGNYKILNGFMASYSLVEGPNYGYFICHGSHAILDGTALHNQFHEFCSVLAGGKLTPETYTIFDYALDEEKYYHSKQRLEDEKYYKTIVGNKLETLIPFDKNPEVDDYYEDRLEVAWNATAIDKYCIANKVQKNNFFATMYMQALGCLTKKKYVMTSSLHSNRGSVELAGILNLTMRNYPVVTDNIIPLDSPSFTDRIRSEIRSLQNQIVRAMDFQFYDYYSMVGLGSKSKNSFDKTTFLYYVGLSDKLFNPVEESAMLGCDIDFIVPQMPGFKPLANDSLCVLMEKGDKQDEYKISLRYNHKYYHTATIKKLADLMTAYYNKVINE